MAARIDPGKGQMVLIRAMAQIKKRRPDLAFKILLVGGSLTGPPAQRYEQELRVRIGQLGLSNEVAFTGYVSNVSDYLNAADIIVQASTHPEAFCLAVLEGMASGKVVIATREGGPGGMIDHGVDGYFHNAGDHVGLAAQIELALDNQRQFPERVTAVGEAAQRKVMQRFSVVDSTRRLEDIYRRLVSSSRAL